jgi:hypothetical protein
MTAASSTIDRPRLQASAPCGKIHLSGEVYRCLRARNTRGRCYSRLVTEACVKRGSARCTPGPADTHEQPPA